MGSKGVTGSLCPHFTYKVPLSKVFNLQLCQWPAKEEESGSVVQLPGLKLFSCMTVNMLLLGKNHGARLTVPGRHTLR